MRPKPVFVLLCPILAIIGLLSAPSSAAAEGATVTQTTGCGYEADMLEVTTPSGTNTRVCQGELVPQEETVVYNPSGDFTCPLPGEQTTTIVIVRTVSGGQTIVCQANPSGQ